MIWRALQEAFGVALVVLVTFRAGGLFAMRRWRAALESLDTAWADRVEAIEERYPAPIRMSRSDHARVVAIRNCAWEVIQAARTFGIVKRKTATSKHWKAGEAKLEVQEERA